MAPTRLLLLGFDPHTIPGVDAAQVDLAIAMGRNRLAELGFEADECLLDLEDPDLEGTVVAALAAQPYPCVVIGGGIRKPEPMLELFERVVNLIRIHAPQAAIAFNSNPVDSGDAARRVL